MKINHTDKRQMAQRHRKSRLSILVVLALMFSILSYMAPVRAAKPAPSVKGGTVTAGKQIMLKITKKAKCKIKTVEAYSDARAKVKVVKTTKTAITVRGLDAPGANVYVYIVYTYPGAKAKQVLKKVAVKVTGAPAPTPSPTASETPSTPTPTASATPIATPTTTPTATPTETPIATPTPEETTMPTAKPTLSPPDPDAVVCPDCHGTGEINDTTCPLCGGLGWLMPAG